MEAPSHITEALYRLHPQARLGWVGEDRLSPEEPLNKGKFALLQLYVRVDAERTFYGEPWNDRGPVFGRPYDRLARLPVMLTMIAPAHVLNGAFLCACEVCLEGHEVCLKVGCAHRHADILIRRWMMSLPERIERAALAKGRQYQAELDNMAGEIGSEVYWRTKHGESAVTPGVELTPEDKAIAAGATVKGVETTFLDNMQSSGAPLT